MLFLIITIPSLDSMVIIMYEKINVMYKSVMQLIHLLEQKVDVITSRAYKALTPKVLLQTLSTNISLDSMLH